MQKRKEFFFNRELSWIEFNRRVLEEAQDITNPLLERVKFLSIFSNNLDEFFMIRVSGLKRQIVSDVNELSVDGMTAQEQINEIWSKLVPLVDEQYNTFNDIIIPELKENNISVFKYDELSDSDKTVINEYFDREVFPILTPLAIDNVHPFPNLVNRSLALAIILDDPSTDEVEEKVCVIQIPSNIPRFYKINTLEGYQYIAIEEIIRANVDKLFPGMHSSDCYGFRITRNADLELEEEEADDLLKLIEEEVKKRRLGILIRLEVDKNMPDKLLNFLVNVLNVKDYEIYKMNGLMNLADLMELYKIDIRSLKYEGFTPRISSYFREAEDDFFKAISQRDILLHHPFYSFSSVSEFVAQAAEDPNVYAIKLTLYRTSGDSPIIKSLIEAAENGKQVTAVVELKARFDEENNIIWARALEKAGVHVVYGLVGLKTHCKLALVVRKEEGGMRRYLHMGTGNYNPATSKIYTDFGLFTCNESFGRDASNLFNYLTGFSKQLNFEKFIVAPVFLRKKLLSLIDNEIASHKQHGNGRIIVKNNALMDNDIILKLYDASKAGVKIDMVVRGICSLRPNIEGLSENIMVHSIVGRFLEHSRAYYFNNNGDSSVHLGSADWMERNLDRRVEVLFPIEDKSIKEDIIEILELYLSDNVKTRVLLPDGSYIRKPRSSKEQKINIQEYFLKKVKRKHEKEIKEEVRKKVFENDSLKIKAYD